jgi:prenyltransferase beta subunit
MQTARTRPEGFAKPANSIHRSQERFFVTQRQMRRLTATGLMLVALCLSFLSAPVAAQDNIAPVDKAITWVLDQQQPDGGFAGFSGESDPGATIDAIFAMVAAQSIGVNADTETAVKYLESGDLALVYAQTSAGSAAKLALALAATGNDPHNFNAVDPLAIVEVGAGMGMIGLGPYDHAFGILALAATDTAVPQLAIDTARDSQIEDGSWAFDGTMTAGAGDTNTTAMMVQALVAAGVTSELVTDATDYLIAAQNDDGGFPYQPGAESDANSTALVIQALIAANEANHADALANAQTALAGMQNESGAFFYMASTPDDNAYATVQAIPALVGVAFPLPAATSVLATPEGTPAG